MIFFESSVRLIILNRELCQLPNISFFFVGAASDLLILSLLKEVLEMKRTTLVYYLQNEPKYGLL